ncbi:uncharacterized protein PV09_00625 [Verruconis gallopava]|uniref:N-acetyltransferase domain-containing protein n=1 Tax=Verruconis gallopava TaxID=253628 RepID=A0A0D2BBH1_9PEZI|nr:uncharacterized protein PV09_00625 [Verruconis gallopava]KIW08674.1 hypothetical protein PV09_00625 [Verruconis gallopava]
MATNSADSSRQSNLSDIIIKKDNLSNQQVISLLNDHFESLEMGNRVSGQKGYVLGLSALQKPDVTVYTAWNQSGQLMGCGALKEISHTHGEIKSVRTIPMYLRKGIATALVQHILDVARHRGYHRVSLETGTREEFSAARALYARSGFVPCEAFEGYEDASSETSMFMTCLLK